MTAGTLEIGGNLTQVSGGSVYNFYTSGTHTVVLNGNQKQTVSIANNSQSYSRINNFKITNTSSDGVDFARYVYVVGNLHNTETPLTNVYNLYPATSAVFMDNAWNHDLIINDNRTLTEDLTIGGTLLLTGGTLNINGKNLTIGGNFNFGTANSFSGGRLTMTNVNDYVLVNGDYNNYSYNSSSGYLTAGTLEVKGNFTQRQYSTSYLLGFYATGSHRVILSGESLQSVSFESIESRFNILEIQNESDEGVALVTPVTIIALIDNGNKISFSGGERAGWKLSEDEVIVGDLTLGLGTLDLNGHKLMITGNLIQSGGIILINGGELEVQGDYRIQTFRNNTYSSSSGTLNMTNSADTVKVFGNFVTQSSVTHNGLLTAGTLEIGGNLTQVSGGSVYNFYTSGTHTLVLNGNQKQTVSIANNSQSYSRINNLKITNTSSDGVDFARYVYVVGNLHNTETPLTNVYNLYPATSAVFVDNTWNHDLVINDNRTLAEDLHIGGTLLLTGGTLNINGKNLTIGGNFNFGTANSFSGGRLTMTNAADYVLVNGDYNNYSYNSSSGYLTAGTLEVKGNFTQKQYSTSYLLGFYATGSHRVILSGESLQNVSFESIESRFNILEIQNESEEGVKLLTPVTIVTLIDNGNAISFSSDERAGWKLTEDETITGDLTLGLGTLDLNGHKLTITGNLTQSGGIALINGGELEVHGDYRIQTFRNNAYSNSSGTLNMTNNADTVKVFGNFVMQSSISHNNLLAAGTLEIGGNLTQIGGNANNFYTSGIHTVILNGNQKQVVSISNNSSSQSRINNLKITNTSVDGVDFSRQTYVVGSLHNTDSIVTNSFNLYAATSMIFADNAWNHDIRISDNRTLTDDLNIGGSLLLAGGTLNINGKNLTIGGNFNFGTANSFSGGRLTMTNAADYVLVNGDYNNYSYNSSNGYLTAGTLEVKGHFTQKQYSTSYPLAFYATGTHKTILSGNRLQHISFESTSSKFNILEITKELNLGYTFNRTPVWNELIEIQAQGAPDAPNNLRFVRSTSSSIMLSWTNMATDRGIESYQIYRDGVLVGQTSNTDYIDNGLQSKTKYTYYITARDFNGNVSEESEVLTASTDVSEFAPAPPVNLSLRIHAADIIALTWTGSPDSARVERYNIWRNDELIGHSNGTSYMDNTAVGGFYTYYVEAEDRDGNASAPSNTASIDNQPPTKPVLSLQTADENQIILNFESTDNIGVTRYVLYKNGTLHRTITGAETFTDTAVEYNKTYTYYVIAFDAQGNSSEQSDELNVFTGTDEEPPAILSITSTKNLHSGNAEISVKASDNHALAKVVLQASSDGVSWTDVGVANALGRAEETLKVTFDTKNFEDGKLNLRAYAEDKSGNASTAADSPVYSITVDNTAPSAPFNLTSDLSGGRIVVKWNYNEADIDTSHFRVYRKAGNESEFKLVRDNHKFIDYSDSNITLGLQYTYKVTAVDFAGNESEYSNEITVSIADDIVPPQILSINPATGSKISEIQTISVSCFDNLMLAGLIIERKDGETWTEIYSENLNQHAQVVSVNIDMTGFATGNYQFRAKATDHAGNESEYFLVTYNYRKPTISAPNLTATGKGWSVELNWTMANTDELLGYNIYKRAANSQNYTRLASITGTVYTDGKVTAGLEYFYKVEAVDSFGNTVISEEISAVPTHEDNIAPIAHAGSDLQEIEGKAVSFDGSKSWDNYHIASYEWDFGDGNTATTAKPTHVFAEQGEYAVTLTVKDSAGNSDTHSVIVTVYGSDKSIVKITSNVGFMRIYSEQAGVDVFADSSGNYELILNSGIYDFYFYSNGYLPQMVVVDTNKSTVNIRLEKKEVMTGELTVRQLELDEIIALGIDITDPANQFVFEYTYEVEYDGKTDTVTFRSNISGETPKEFGQTVHVGGQTFTDTSGNLVFQQTGVIGGNWSTSRPGSSDCGECAGCKNPNPCTHTVGPIPCSCEPWVRRPCLNPIANPKPATYPPVVNFKITQHTSWLKSFYEVELSITNHAGSDFSIEDALAAITLPDGLSLADTARLEVGEINMGTIDGGDTKSASWIVRGDKAGSYDITANFTGLLMPFGEPISATFTTAEPLVVLGGEAIKFEIIHDGFAQGKQTWDVEFTLTNISEKDPIYNVQFDFIGELVTNKYAEAEITDMVVEYPRHTVVIPWNNGKPNESDGEIYFNVLLYDAVDPTLVLEPGESITGRYTVSFKWTQPE